jgi:hypothetical protein
MKFYLTFLLNKNYMATTLSTTAMHIVPTVDTANNSYLRDVVGNKSDTAAGTSLIGLTKAVKAKTDTIAAVDLAVPTADVATNTTTRDVVGNKSDTVAGTSLVSVAKQIKAKTDYTEDIVVVSKASTVDGNGAQTDNIFTFTGNVELLLIYGVCTAVTNATTYGNVSWKINDGTNTVDLTYSGATCSGITVGSLLIKNAVAGGTPLSYKASAGCLTLEGTAGSARVATPIILTAKNGVTNYIRHEFTGDANTNVSMTFYVKYRSFTIII